MKSDSKDKIIEQNTLNINNKIDNVDTNKLIDNLKDNLGNYLSLALRNTHYYGNLRIKYVSFNFTFTALYASILAIFISFTLNSNLSLWYIGLPIMVGLLLYFIYFLILLIVKFDIVSFDLYHLQHYSSILDKIEDYPNITIKNLNNLLALIDKNENNKEREQTNPKKPRIKLDLMKNDLKALIFQYLYQTNYHRVALIMLNCLTYGSVNLVISMFSSFLLLIFVDPNLFEGRLIVIISYGILSILILCIILKKSRLRLNTNRPSGFPIVSLIRIIIGKGMRCNLLCKIIGRISKFIISKKKGKKSN
jgi:hypothetical protein